MSHPVLDVNDVNAAVGAAMQRAFPGLDVERESEIEIVRESVSAEIIDASGQNKPPRTKAELERTVGYLLSDLFALGAEQEELEGFYDAMATQMDALLRDPQEEEGEDLEPGTCCMCERPMPLTFHHLIPKTTHAWYRKHGEFTEKQLSSGIDICRPCHNAVHTFADHRTLAEQYNTLERILELDSIQKFIQWVRKQPIRKREDAVHNGLRYRK
eukprot:TRINITY_DN3377_c0_g1_i1.p1 TRINITY_DN3377_c0_g1~~TRINITY_DN3377_c0_g1_i1.p1  ORF type:complete len:214 (+),score=56.68 TRINITY_DN3377_c0_g1_i1:50-691(+)